MYLISNKPTAISIRIPAGERISEPIEITINKSSTLTIEAGKKSCATVIIRVAGKTDAKKLELKQSIIAHESSELRVVEFQNLPADTYYIARRKAELKKYAGVSLVLLQIGSRSSDGVFDVYSEYSACNLSALQVAKKDQKHHSVLNNYFIQPASASNIVSKSIATDEGVIEIEGKLVVPKSIGPVAAYLKLQSLLLSRKARVVATPALEIASDDVSVSHSASVSNLDDEQLFYFASRGVDPAQARQMMVKGFVGDIMERLNDLPDLKKCVLDLL